MKNFMAGLVMAAFAAVSNAQTGLQYPDEMIAASINGDEAEVLKTKARADLAEKPQRGDRKSARALNTKGLADISAGNFDSAIEALTKAGQADPLDAEIPSNLGYAYLKKGAYEQAKRALAQSISLQPGRGSTWATLAEAFARSGDIEKATACFNIAFTFSQNRDKTKEFLSKIVTENADAKLTTAAKAALATEGIKPLNNTARPVVSSVQYADAKAAYERKDFPAAFRLFKEVLDQGDSKAEYAIGVMYLKGEGTEKNLPKAMDYFKRSVEHNDPRSMNLLGNTYLDGSYGVPADKEKGIGLLEKAAQSGFEPAVKKLQEVKSASSISVSSECPPLDRAGSDSYLSGLDGNTALAKTKAEVNRYISEYCNLLPNLFRGYVTNGLQRDDFRCVLSQQQINDLRNLSQIPADKAQKIANSAFEQIPQRCPTAMVNRYQPRFSAFEAKELEMAAKAKEQEKREQELAASKKDLAKASKEKYGDIGLDSSGQPTPDRKKCLELAVRIRQTYRSGQDFMNMYDYMLNDGSGESCKKVPGTAASAFVLALYHSLRGEVEESQQKSDQFMKLKDSGVEILENNRDWQVELAITPLAEFNKYAKLRYDQIREDTARLKALAEKITYADFKQGIANIQQMQKYAANSPDSLCNDTISNSLLRALVQIQRDAIRFNGFKDAQKDPTLEMAKMYRKMRSIPEKVPSHCYRG